MGDKLIKSSTGEVTISNDGATGLSLLDVVHPAAKTVVDIAASQDAVAGDGTTSVVLLAGAFMQAAKEYVQDGVHPRVIVRAFRKAAALCKARIEEIAVTVEKGETDTELRELLTKCAATAMSSKLIHHRKDLFAPMVVDAVLLLDDDLDLDMLAIKKVTGASLNASELIAGVAFKKTFSYAGFEQQPKAFDDAKVLLLNVELELKAEKDNAEIRIDDVSEYQRIVDAEYRIIGEKMDNIVATGANVILSKLPIGDLATQFFADKGIFCAGFDATDILNKLRQRHAMPDGKWFGVDIMTGDICDTFESFVWEPVVMTQNAVASAAAACNSILLIDETVKAPQSQQMQ